MATYSYEDFENALNSSGLSGQFSTADLALAKQNPDAGMSLISYKQDWAKATTDDARALANAGANSVRSSYGGYTGGADGGSFYKNEIAPSDFETPAYTSPYSGQIAGQLGKVQGAFSYDHTTDPSYSAYKKEYTREGDRATKDALGQAAATTGGIASTAAVTAAGQAGQYYASKLTDKIPELRQQAFGNYITEKNTDLAILNALQGMDNDEYGRYTDSRNFDYSKLLDDISVDTDRANTAYTQKQYTDAMELAALQERAANLAALGDYSLYRELGYTDAEIDLLRQGWAVNNPKMNQALYGAPVSSGGYSGGGSGGSGSNANATVSGSSGSIGGTVSYSAAANNVQQWIVDDMAAGYSANESINQTIEQLKNQLSTGEINQRIYDTYAYAINNLGNTATTNTNREEDRRYNR